MKRLPPVLLPLVAALFAAPAALAAPAPVAPAAAETAFADACADLVLDGAAPARWLLAEPGPLADALARRSAVRKAGVAVVPVRGLTRSGAAVAERAARDIPQANVRDALDLGPAPFVLAWIAADGAAAASNVVLATLPTLPLSAHFAAVPDGAVFRLAPEEPAEPEALRALAARHDAFRDALGELLAAAPPEAARARADAARLAGLLGNNLGVLLARAGLRDEAAAAFRSADAAYPQGHSALLNLATLARASDETAAAALHASGLAHTDAEGIRAAFEAMPDDGVRRAALEAFRPSAALQSGNALPLAGLLAQMGDEGWTLPLALRAADLLFFQNERPAAQRLLWKAAALPGADPFALALLRADYAARAGDGAAARRELALAALAARPDVQAPWREPFARGLEAAGAGPTGLAEARPAFLAAAAAETNFWPSLRLALQCDLQAGDLPAAAADAAALLRRRPFDYFAHYVSAMSAAAAGDGAAAQRHYQFSLAQRPVWFVLNDYASFLAGEGNPALAERMARDALAATGGAVAAVHDTLGETLFAQKRYAEAAQAFAKAVETDGEAPDPRFRLHWAEALLENGDAAGAAALLPDLEKGAAAFSDAEKDRAARLRARVAPPAGD